MKIFNPLVMWLLILFGAVYCLREISVENVFPPNGYIAILLIPAIINWLYLMISAARAHPESNHNTEKVTQLIQTGIYGRLRHPMYLADIVLVWAVWLFLPQLRILVFATWLTLVLVIWIIAEERALRLKFGQEHANYTSRVPMVIPRWGRK